MTSKPQPTNAGLKRPKPHQDLRELIGQIEDMGELLTVDGADWDLEVGAILELVYHDDTENPPAIVFDNIKGYPKGFRISSGTTNSPRRFAKILGLPDPEHPLDAVRSYRDRMKEEFKLIPPREVNGGPILENIDRDDEVDLFKFPVPRIHELDGGRYIGTDDLIIMRDPDTGWVNLGTYRVQVHDKNTTGLWISPGKQGRLILDKYHAKGENCPVLICVGHDPLLFLAGSNEVAHGVCEYDYAAGHRGEPYDVINSEVYGLPMPAHAEIVLEGEVLAKERRAEGPFGEYTGYYASGEQQQPIVKIKRVYYRNDPVMTVACPMRPPTDYMAAKSMMKSAMIWDEMERAGVPGVEGVWIHWASRMFCVVSIKQLYAGHAKQAGLVATGCFSGAYLGRYTIVVDEDIDPTDIHAVIWAMGSRSEPTDDIDIIRRMWSTPLDPMLKEGPWQNSRAIIDACRPWGWKDQFPATVETSPPLRKATREKWGHLLKRGRGRD